MLDFAMQVRDCGSLLTVGGFNIPAVDVDDITIHYKDFKGVVNHLRCAIAIRQIRHGPLCKQPRSSTSKTSVPADMYFVV